jgi:hypothetical protein
MGYTIGSYLFFYFYPLVLTPLTLKLKLEVFWGIATLYTSTVKSYRSLYALRFLVGLFE